jgi:hypothetical protein
MREKRSTLKNKPRRRDRTEGVPVPRPGSHIRHVDDVLWWAKVNNREPFVSAANQIRSAGTKAKHVLWHKDNTMEVVVSR